MCLFYSTIENPRYKERQETHPALKYVTAKCGLCIECRQARAREWQQRLEAEMERNDGLPHTFVTLTISDEVAESFGIDYSKGWPEDHQQREEMFQKENRMVKELVKKWRKACDKAQSKQRHFLITEHGETRTERIHMHGILWGEDIQGLAEKWKFGIADVGEMRDSTIGYVVKYIHKAQEYFGDYKPVVLATPGIGRCYIDTHKEEHRWKGRSTNFLYRLKSGAKVALCDYYMHKLFTRQQLEMRRMWIWKEGTRWVRGIEYMTNNVQEYNRMIEKITYEQKKYGKVANVLKTSYISRQNRNQVNSKVNPYEYPGSQVSTDREVGSS